MKKSKLMIILLFLTTISFGQSPYTLSVRQEVYEDLQNPTNINNGQIWNENSSFPVFFNFNFPIAGDTVTSVNLNPGYGFNFPCSGYYHMCFFHWPYGGPLLLDRGFNSSASASSLDYEITGSVGNRIVKLQWSNAGFLWDITSNGSNTVTEQDFINFQVWLYELDGKIEMHFGPKSILNPDSYCGFASMSGPWPKFIIGDNLIDIFGNADNPSYQWISNIGIVYGNPIVGIPSEEKVYEFNPNFTTSTKMHTNIIETINIFNNQLTNNLIIDIANPNFKKATISVYSTNGQLLLEKELTHNHQSIETNNLRKGVILVKVIVDNNSITKKIIK